MYYILDENKQPVKTEDFKEWLNILNEDMRRVAFDEINDVTISTVFLGIDHGHGKGIPILWETMCFSTNQDYNDYQERYTSHEDALKGHQECVEAIKANKPLIERKTIKLKI